jgi:hypothetical protein
MFVRLNLGGFGAMMGNRRNDEQEKTKRLDSRADEAKAA